ncbi:MAG: protein translocase subunit SecF [Inhella sp.]|jgi:preprotein translocase subunit SecF|uniref:protein translocase subunit SecF n=1 Tax=Inhella sp. TaxID=1921806 RepID=UPI0022BCFB71|nr:protein translocase subunit SecF [Inhella sp.]MCZ8234013.1 protein translocase subunit SecF [Inhella sp.]
MELFRIQRDIPFMKYALVFNAISFLTFAVAVFFLVTRGLYLSIEFTGGTVMEVEYAQAADPEAVRHAVEPMQLGEFQVQKFGSSRDLMLRLPVREGRKQGEVVTEVFARLCSAQGGQVESRQSVSDKGEQVSREVCAKADGTEPLKLSRTEVVGPSVGAELARDGAYGLAFTIIGIMIYLAFRFEWKFSVAGIVANLHDVVIILGFFAYFQWEFSLAVLAAVLAVLGYSVNESVVIFDRVREAFRKYRKMTPAEVINHAITSTMSRTFITHGSTQIMVLSMLIFGGPTLKYFAVALTIGILFGIYSSVFVAAAIAMWLGVKREDLVKTTVKTDDPNDPNAGAVV